MSATPHPKVLPPVRQAFFTTEMLPALKWQTSPFRGFRAAKICKNIYIGKWLLHFFEQKRLAKRIDPTNEHTTLWFLSLCKRK